MWHLSYDGKTGIYFDEETARKFMEEHPEKEFELVEIIKEEHNCNKILDTNRVSECGASLNWMNKCKKK